MPFYFTPWMILPLLSALINGALAIHAFSRRRLPAAAWLALLTTGLAGWSLSYALHMGSISLWWKTRFFESGSLFFCLVLFAMWPMILRVIGRDKPFRPALLMTLGLVPLLSSLIVLTNDLHGLMRHSSHLVHYEGLVLLAFEHGTYFKYFHIFYVYLLFLFAALFCLMRALRKKEQRRIALLLTMTATLPPLLVDFFKISPFPELTFTTSFLFLSGICYWLAVFRFHFLDLVPEAKAAFFTQMKDPALVLDRQGRLAEANPAAYRDLPLPANAQGLSLVALQPADSLLTWIVQAGDQEVIVDNNTGRCWQIGESSAIRHGIELGRLLVLRDVSELRRVEEELRQSEQRLIEVLGREQQARREQERFLTMIAHEYRTPLAILQANLDLVDIGVPVADNIKNPMQRALDRLLDIFQMARSGGMVDLDKKMGQPVRIKVGPFMEEVLSTARGFWGERFFMSGLEGLRGEIYGDPPLLRTAIMNLLDNAVKYSPPASRVELKLALQAGKVQLRVENTSQLPLPSATADLFLKFQRGPNSTGTVGSGLGLYIARSILLRYAGELELISQSPHRVTVKALIPFFSVPAE